MTLADWFESLPSAWVVCVIAALIVSVLLRGAPATIKSVFVPLND